jgi:hypothetical protein
MRSRSSSPIVSVSGSLSRFFGVRSGSAGSRTIRFSSTRKRKKHLSAVVRAWLDTAGPPLLFLGEKRAQVRDADLREFVDPLTLQVIQTRRNVTLVS